MAKNKFKQVWSSITAQLINKKSRERVFIFLTTFIFTYVSLGCTIVNFVTKQQVLAFFTLGCFIALFAIEIAQFIIFTKFKKSNNIFLAIPTLLVLSTLVISYLFLAPARSMYIFWICVIPISSFLTYGMKRGIISSSILFGIILLVFFVPPLYELTNFSNQEDHWLIKAFFIIYYVMCSSIGLALAYVNSMTIKQLDQLKNVYYEDANTDSLTGLRNQAYYLTYVNSLPSVVKEGDTIGLMFIDIDDFKLYNDKFGHTIGNEVLISVAKKINEVPHALCVRWGGDEFAIVERNITRDEFIAKANYLNKSVAGLPSGVTISIGLAYFIVDENFNFQKVFKEADMQAIRAKGKGKNCIVIKEDK